VKTYLTTYVLAILTAVVITPLVIRLAKRYRIVDSPGPRNIHVKKIPRIGGVAIFAAVILPTIAVLFLPNFIGTSFRLHQNKIIGLLACGTFMFIVGLYDDLKGMRARTKFACQLIASVVVCWFGIHIETLAIANWLTIDFGWFAWPLTIFWIVGITNAVNLIDGLDGLAAGICAIACGVLAILAVFFGLPVMAVITLAMLGGLTGFLFFNFYPAKVFMGDCGSMFIGFIIAASSVLCAAKSSAIVAFALPILALGIPIFDTLFSMLRRYLSRRSLFAADRSHFHHRLLDMGLNQRHVAVVAYTVTIIVAGLGMFMMVSRNTQTIVIFFCILILIMLVFRMVGAVRLKEAIAKLQRKYEIESQSKEDIRTFEEMQLHFTRASKFSDWWNAICIAAQNMEFIKVTLPLKNRDGSVQALVWRRAGTLPEGKNRTVSFSLPVKDRRGNSLLAMEVVACANGSLEAIGRRVSLFGRLMDEHCLGTLQSQKENSIDGDSTDEP
jgi:UDP-N-acetylmuramyl pentapeptide phosphotransferase/UDP-N-acetylglucosamine-1-phosphate transferase